MGDWRDDELISAHGHDFDEAIFVDNHTVFGWHGAPDDSVDFDFTVFGLFDTGDDDTFFADHRVDVEIHGLAFERLRKEWSDEDQEGCGDDREDDELNPPINARDEGDDQADQGSTGKPD